MQIETIADIGDNIEIKVNKDESKLARIIRIDIFSMDRGCYACEYTTDLLKCTRKGDDVIQEHIIIPQHRIKRIGNKLYSVLND